jgi:hypothetical protein
MPLLLFLVFVVLAGIAAIPIGIIQRYRRGAIRRRARGWVAVINVAGLTLSSTLLLTSAAITGIWVPGALVYALAGFATGLLLGLVGLRLTRWEGSPDSLYYTPNVWLTFGITSIVTARLLYGFWRAWHAWRTGTESGSWLIAAGVAGSMAAGAIVVGYYLAYWLGVRQRFRRTVWARRH